MLVALDDEALARVLGQGPGQRVRRASFERAQGGLGSAMAVTLMLSLIVIIVLIFSMARQKEERA